MSLEDVLEYLCQYGLPRLSKFKDNTWYCGVEMFVTGQGCTFKIESDYKEPNPLAAAPACKARVDEALTRLAKPAPTIGVRP